MSTPIASATALFAMTLFMVVALLTAGTQAPAGNAELATATAAQIAG